MRGNVLRKRAILHADVIRDAGEKLDSCVEFIDCTTIKICRPGDTNKSQRSVCSGNKRIHCIIYKNITTPDGLMFSIHGSDVGRRHDLTPFR